MHLPLREKRWQCRVFANCLAATTSFSGSDQKADACIPVDGKANAVRSLLELIYSPSPNTLLADIFAANANDFKAAIELAHQYDIPALLAHIDVFLSKPASSSAQDLWPNEAAAIAWTELACRCALPSFSAACEVYLVHHLLEVIDLEQSATLHPDTLLRIFRRALDTIQTAKLPETSITCTSRCFKCNRPAHAQLLSNTTHTVSRQVSKADLQTVLKNCKSSNNKNS